MTDRTSTAKTLSAAATTVAVVEISKYESFVQTIPNRLLVIVPLIIPSYLLLFQIVMSQSDNIGRSSGSSRHILGYIFISILGYLMTQQLIPHISLYTLRKNIYGKDLGKRNTKTADVPMYVGVCFLLLLLHVSLFLSFATFCKLHRSDIFLIVSNIHSSILSPYE